MSAKVFNRRQQTLDERWPLFAAFMVGVIAIFLLPEMGVGQLAKAFIVATIVAAYTFVIWRGKTSNAISMEKASDNAYYLGLIFTLISLFRTLLFFDDSASASIVSDFATALLSTICGVVCRTLLQQISNDPGDIEMAARRDLAQSLGQMRHDLGDLINHIRLLTSVTRTAFEEIQQEVSQTISSAASETATQMKNVAAEMARVSEVYKGLAQFPDALEDSLQRLTSHVDEFAKTTHQSSEIQHQYNKQLATTVTELKSVIDSLQLEDHVSRTQETARYISAVSEGFINLRQSMETAARSVNNAVETAANISSRMNESSEAVANFANGLNERSAAMDDTLNLAETSVDQFTNQLIQGTRKLRDATEASSSLDMRHEDQNH